MFNFFKKKKQELPKPKYNIGTKIIWFDTNTNLARNVVVIDYVIEDNKVTYIVGSEDCEQIWEFINEENLFKK